MNTKIIFLALSITLSSFISAAHLPVGDVRIDIAEEVFQAESPRASSLNIERGFSASAEDSVVIAHRTGIRQSIVREAHQILSDDFIDHLKDLRKTRWFFRKAANYIDAAGNVIMGPAVGLTTISALMCLIEANGIANTLLFAGVGGIIAHDAFIRIARYCAQEEQKRENLLKNLGRKVGFSIVSVLSTITNGAESGGGITGVLNQA